MLTIKEVSEKYGISQDTLRYYERIGLIPPVPRAGVQIEALIEYVRLYQMGDSTIEARRDLLQEQYEVLEEQRRQINATMERLKYKISRYQKAVETGVLSWEKEEEN